MLAVHLGVLSPKHVVCWVTGVRAESSILGSQSKS